MDDPNIVWFSTLDQKYVCMVKRIETGKGRLIMVEQIKPNRVILDQDVDLTFNAVFGPDIDDISEWEDLCISMIDGNKHELGNI